MLDSATLQVHIVNDETLTLAISAGVAVATFLVASVAVWQILKDSRRRARDEHIQLYRRQADAVIDAVAAAANAAALFANVLPALKPLERDDADTAPEERDRALAMVETVEPSRQAAHSARLRVRVLSGSGEIYEAVDRLVSIIDGQRSAARALLKWTAPGAQRTGLAPERDKLLAPGIGDARRECIDIAYHLAKGADPPRRPEPEPTDATSGSETTLALLEAQAVRVHRGFFGLGPDARISASAARRGDLLEISIEGDLFGFDELDAAPEEEVEHRFQAFRTRVGRRRVKEASRLLASGILRYDVVLLTEPTRLVERFTLPPAEAAASTADAGDKRKRPSGGVFPQWRRRHAQTSRTSRR
jgi:hypothetical protein